VFRRKISSSDAELSIGHFNNDLLQGIFQVFRIPDEAFQRAQQISKQKPGRLGTRTADLLHVAAALELGIG
jgi:hypothetical protein